MFIVIEGLDASGKTTQTELLVKKYQSLGKKVHTLDFPQYEHNVFGKILKRFLSNEFGNSVNLDPKLSALLFAGDRLESKNQLVRWKNDPDAVVILNRYVGSNLAYNRAKSTSEKEANEIEELIVTLEYDLLGLPKPDVVVVLGSSAAITKARLGTQTDAYESDSKFLDRVAQEYVYLCDTYSNWILLPIEKDQTRESVHDMIFKTIQNETKSK